MAVTSGFYNSLNGDRKYNAEDMSSLFDGIINDGVFATIGQAFKVSPNSGNSIIVDIGKAWFNGKYVKNDALLPIDCSEAELLQDRYDAVVIEVDKSDSVRDGDIKVVFGTPSTEPVYPTLTKSEMVNQYPIAYILRPAGSTEITASNIINRVGTSECPYVTGLLSVMTIDNIVAQWEAQWDEWFSNEKTEASSEADQYMAEAQASFETWFDSLQLVLEGDVATSLAESIATLQSQLDNLMVSTEMIEDCAVTDPKLADNAVTTTKIADGAITAGKLGPDAVTKDNIDVYAVQTEHIEPGAIVASKIADGTVTIAELADNVLIPENIKTAGTLGAKVLANASAVLTYNARQLRNVLFCTSTSNISVSNGDIVHLYE